jgi:hypothetical protein
MVQLCKNFIDRHIVKQENVQKDKKEKKRENSHDIKLGQTRCQNLSMSNSTTCSQLYFFI